MAGIAGAVFRDIFHVHLYMEEMLKTLTHRSLTSRRGVSQDLYTYKNVRLGITGGHVFTGERRDFAVVLDGEIYNRDALTEEIAKKERYPKNDSELIVDLFSLFHEKAFEKLDGDFAFALFSHEDSQLYLVRDRVGIKPLYWYTGGTPLLFASELKALLKTGAIPLAPSEEAIASYLSLGYIPQDMTPIKEVSKLLPGHFLRFSLEKGTTIHPYWSYSRLLLDSKKSEAADLEERLLSELSASIKERVVTPKSGCYLSGGIGSASVAKGVAELFPFEEIPAFTVGYTGQYRDDVEATKIFAEGLHLNQTVGQVTPDNLLNSFAKIVWLLDEPLADPNIVATWKLTELAKEETHHLFSGMGCDELLAGHLRYTKAEQKSPLWYFAERLKRRSIELSFPLLRRLLPVHSFSFLRSKEVSLQMLGYLEQATLFSQDELAKACPLLTGRFSSTFFLHKFHNLPSIESPLKGFLYLDFKTRLPDLYIAQYERLNTGQGIDWRAPFLSKRMIELASSIPDSVDAAELMRRSLYKQFPKETVRRPKKTRHDLLVPLLERSGLIFYFEGLKNGTLVESGILSNEWIHDATKSKEEMANRFRELFALFVLEVWFRLFMQSCSLKTFEAESLEELFIP